MLILVTILSRQESPQLKFGYIKISFIYIYIKIVYAVKRCFSCKKKIVHFLKQLPVYSISLKSHSWSVDHRTLSGIIKFDSAVKSAVIRFESAV